METELIVINDGSQDSTWDIFINNCLPKLKRSGFSKIKIADSDIRLFLPTRRNQAINISEGDFIAIHDGDDISLKGRFNRQFKLLNEHRDLFCVGGHANKIDESSSLIGEMSYPPENNNRIVLEFYGGKMNPTIDPTTMFRSNCVKSLGGYSLAPDKYTIPDFDLWLRAISFGYKFYNLQEPLVTYRINSSGMTRKHNTVMVEQHRTSMRELKSGEYKNRNSNWLNNTLEIQYETFNCMD